MVMGSLAAAGVVAGLMAYALLHWREDRTITTRFHLEAQQRSRSVDREMARSVGVLRVAVGFFNASQSVERDEFRAFALPLVSGHAGIEFLGWAPRILDTQRKSHEDDTARLVAGYRIRRLAADGRFEAAASAPEYYPLHYLEPTSPGATWLGVDLATVESLREAISRAGEADQREAACRAPLLGPDNDPRRVLALAVVQVKGLSSDAANPRCQNQGVVLLAMRVDTIQERALATWPDVGIDFYLADQPPGQAERIVCAKPSSLSQADSAVPTVEEFANAPLLHSETFSIADRPWTVYARPSESYLKSQRTWLPLGVALACAAASIPLMLAAGAAMGRAEKIQQEVVQRTAELQRAYETLQRETDERRRAEQVLRDSQALYSSLVENLPVHVLRKDLDGKFTFANTSFCRMAGRSLEEILGKTDFDLYPAELAEKYRRDDQTVAETGRLFHDVEANQGEGEMRYVEVMKSPVHDAERRVVGTQAVFWDVTQRWLAEKERERSKQAAEAANRAKSAFLANMSHEIRTPLNAILGLTELVLATPLSAEQREYLTAVHDSGESLLLLINDILDFSRIEAGRIDLDRTPFELRESLGDVMRLMAIRAHRKGLELACRVAAEVPQAVVGDSARLRQVVVNVVDNAIKFTEHGEVLLDVTRSQAADGQVELQFDVSDTGIGVPSEKQQVIFGAFEQGESSMSRRFGGTGLGLAISARLVELMGGRMWLDSHVGQGSVFHFTVRLETGPLRAVTVDQARAFDETRVLVVDDNATCRRVVGEMLTQWGMRSQCQADPTQVAACLREARAAGDPFRLALIDAHMPQFDGFLLAEQILRDAELSLPVVMLLTSGDRPGDISRCEQLGAAGYVLKPVKQSDLFDALSSALGITAAAIHSGEAQLPGPRFSRPLAILLAEDSEVNQKLVRGLLARQGHVVTVANNGQEALDAVERHHFDLLLLDIQMPQMDGLQVASELRARERHAGGHLPVIAMTAHAMAGDRDTCLAAGMDAYVTKPIRARVLLDTIAELLGGNDAAAAPSPVPPAESGLAAGVDWGVAKDAVHGDERLLGEVCRALLEESPRLLAAMRQAIETGDGEALRRAAHTIKSSAGYFGAQAAFDRAFQIESQSQHFDPRTAAEAVADLENQMEQILAEVARYTRSGKDGCN
jgi:PAS domain S-box-containing protein